MTEFWKSEPKHYCEDCHCWIDAKQGSIRFHSQGRKHKENAARNMRERRYKRKQDDINASAISRELKNIEKNALKAYRKDVADGYALDKHRTDMSSIYQKQKHYLPPITQLAKEQDNSQNSITNNSETEASYPIPIVDNQMNQYYSTNKPPLTSINTQLNDNKINTEVQTPYGGNQYVYFPTTNIPNIQSDPEPDDFLKKYNTFFGHTKSDEENTSNIQDSHPEDSKNFISPDTDNNNETQSKIISGPLIAQDLQVSSLISPNQNQKDSKVTINFGNTVKTPDSIPKPNQPVISFRKRPSTNLEEEKPDQPVISFRKRPSTTNIRQKQFRKRDVENEE